MPAPDAKSDTAKVEHLAIIAGGKGTRIAGLAGDLPKALIPACGKPVLQHQLELAAQCGVRSVTIFAGHRGEQIRAFVDQHAGFGMRIDVLLESKPLGNAGALTAALDALPEHFFVMYCDVILAVDLAAMARRHIECAADFTTFVHPNDHPRDSDLIEADEAGWVRAIHSYPHPEHACLPNLVNAALYVVRRDALTPGHGAPRDFTRDIIPGLLASKARVLAYSSSEYIKDMGTPERLERVEQDMAAGRLDTGPQAATKRHPAVFLDRDGTLNREVGFLANHEQLELIPGAGKALRQLRQSGYRLIVVTNQPVIARGEASEADMAAIHCKLEWELGKAGAFVDAIYLCPHHPDGGYAGERAELKGPCTCRKPGTAMIDQAEAEHRLDLGRSWVIGDRTADIELARRKGLRSVLVQTGAAGQDLCYDAVPDFVASDIGSAADVIIAVGAQ